MLVCGSPPDANLMVLAPGKSVRWRDRVYEVARFDAERLVLLRRQFVDESGARRFALLDEAQKRRKDMDIAEKRSADEADAKESAAESEALELVRQSHKRRISEITEAAQAHAPKVRTTEITLPARESTDWGLTYLPEASALVSPGLADSEQGFEILDLGAAPGDVEQMFFAPGCLLFSLRQGDSRASGSHARWKLDRGEPEEFPQHLVGLLEKDGEFGVLTASAAEADNRRACCLTECETGRHVDSLCKFLGLSRASSCQTQRRVAISVDADSWSWVKLCSWRQEGFVFDGSMTLPLELKREWDFGEGTKVALSLCCMHLAIVAKRLDVWTVCMVSLAKHMTSLVCAVPVNEQVACVVFRQDYVVTVTASGRVTYHTFQLEVVGEYELGRPVTAAAVRDDIWALVSEGRVYLCQDQFYMF